MGFRFLVAVVFAFGAVVSYARFAPDADVLPNGKTLVINGIDALTIKTSAGGYAPEERVAVIAKALAGFKRGQTVRVVADPGMRVALQDATVVTITVAEAKAQGRTPDELAEDWSKSINKALYVPALAILDSQLDLIFGKSQSVRIVGAMARKAEIRVEPAGAVEVTRRGFDLVVMPVELGEGQIQLFVGDLSYSIPFIVMAYAANLPQTLTVEVTGNPASKELVIEAIRGAMSTKLEAFGNAAVRFSIPGIDSVLPGESKVIQVATKVDSAGFAPSSGWVSVVVKNLGGGRIFEDSLWYSNEPENVKGTGQLYYARLTTDSPDRLLWHHCNKTRNPMVIQYVLVNRSDKDARIWIVDGDPVPNLDPTKAGFEAGKAFFANWMNYQGSIVVIPARSVVPIVMRRLMPEETTSGLASMRLMPGGSDDVVLVANALWPNEVAGEWQPQGMDAKPWLVRRAMGFERFSLPVVGKEKHIYESPAKQLGFMYQVGGKLGFVRIGQESIKSKIGGEPLSGNFGVHYIIEGRVENPTDKERVVEVVFEASAGYSGALFSVNGKVLPGKMLQTKETMTLYEVKLAPGQAEDIRIETMPLSGAHYPATITVRTKGTM
ncbi:MAG: hypothetical protein ACKVQS_06160 [Fimbriimonadaceae bacterium]